MNVGAGFAVTLGHGIVGRIALKNQLAHLLPKLCKFLCVSEGVCPQSPYYKTVRSLL
jgi:hypothetical protein